MRLLHVTSSLTILCTWRQRSGEQENWLSGFNQMVFAKLNCCAVRRWLDRRKNIRKPDWEFLFPDPFRVLFVPLRKTLARRFSSPAVLSGPRRSIDRLRLEIQGLKASVLLWYVFRVKSAYELAMERLQKEAPIQTLSPEQKAALAEVESRYRSKVAERELLLGDEIQAALSAGDYVKAESLRDELTRERNSLEAERESRKEAIRQGQQVSS